MILFTVPLSSREEDKLLVYELIEGTQMQLIGWDLDAPGYAIPCLECNDGLLKKVQFHMAKIGSASMTPIFDMYGPTGYKMGGYYKCTAESCKCRLKSTGRKLLHAIPGWLKKSLLLNPKWSNPTGSFQLAKSASQLLEQAMLTQRSAKSKTNITRKTKQPTILAK
jgi:hypothetical protein